MKLTSSLLRVNNHTFHSKCNAIFQDIAHSNKRDNSPFLTLINQQTMHSYKVNNRQKYLKLRDDRAFSSIGMKAPERDNTKEYSSRRNDSNDCIIYQSCFDMIKPDARRDWNLPYSRERKDDGMDYTSPFSMPGFHPEFTLQVDDRNVPTYVDTREPNSNLRGFEDSSSRREHAPDFAFSDICCYLHGVDQQVISPPRLSRRSSMNNASFTKTHDESNASNLIHRRLVCDAASSFPVQTRHVRSKAMKYEICKPVVPIYGHSCVGQPRFGIHRLRLPNQFLPILDQSKLQKLEWGTLNHIIFSSF